MERKYLYLGKNIFVNEKGNIKDFMNLGIYKIFIDGYSNVLKKDSLYERKDFTRFSYSNFFEVLSEGFKYISNFNNSITLNIIKEWSRTDNLKAFEKIESKELYPILQLRFYKVNDIIYLGKVLSYDIKNKNLNLNGDDFYKEDIKKCIPNRISKKKYSVKSIKFNISALYPEDKNKLKSSLMDSLDKVSSIINFKNLENFNILFEDTRKKRESQFKNSGGYYLANKRLISLNSTGDYFIENTLYHELGHHIDYSLQRKYGNSFMKSIKKRLFKYLISEITLTHILNNKNIISSEVSDYLLSHNEVFARIISEYIYIKLNSKKDFYKRYSSYNLDDCKEIKLVSTINHNANTINISRFTYEEVEKCEPILKLVLNL